MATRRRLPESEIRDLIRQALREDAVFDDVQLPDEAFTLRQLPESPDHPNWAFDVVTGGPGDYGREELRAIHRAGQRVALRFDIDWP